ncbi:MAG: hypothetical protein DSY43_01225 [Gammaproteobacteria bacterium]|nr:MAG: hypothetical protein DSY43_01225 [Gammaproteobacteria bacterium]
MLSNFGKAWIIIEEHFHTQEYFLISIINARKGKSYIREYIEQIYVDKFASINEKFIYKKNRNNLSAYQEHNYQGNIVSVGHEPTFRGYYCDSFKIIDDDTLEFSYKTKGRVFTEKVRINNNENT